MKANLLLIVSVLFAVAAGLAIRATLAMAESHRALAGLVAQREELQRKHAALEEQLRREKAAIVEMARAEAVRAKNSGAANRSAATGDQSSNLSAATARKLSPASLVARDPGKMAEYAKNYRESLNLTLGGMFRQLGLSPEQIEKVKDLKVWDQQSRMDLDAAAEAHGLNLHGRAYDKLRYEDLQNERQAKEVELFGKGELLERYQNYSRLGYLRDTVGRIASSEMGAETPATFAQVERAIAIIAASTINPDPWSWPARGWSWVDWAKINWEVAGPQLQRELLPGQYVLLRQFLKTQEVWTAVASRNAANQNQARRLTSRPGG